MSFEEIVKKTDRLKWGESKYIKDPYGFIYITTNLINGKRYIGQKKFDDQGVWTTYMGSGTHLKKAINKYGADHFTRSIVDIAYTKDELDKKENEWINALDAVASSDYYNLIDGGSGGSRPSCFNLAFKNSELHRLTIDGFDWEEMKLFEPNLSEQ